MTQHNVNYDNTSLMLIIFYFVLIVFPFFHILVFLFIDFLRDKLLYLFNKLKNMIELIYYIIICLINNKLFMIFSLLYFLNTIFKR